ncbi:MXAN_6640 family putative metalloprotease [Nocardioides psychrotolerans]|uniref:MXAN_6640 family putative metalloprotease n=1 Tax=Nocardioides psychrotolerans TaxID=1005945 RepID=UPI0031379DA9
MRRTIAAVVVAMSTAVTVLPVVSSQAATTAAPTATAAITRNAATIAPVAVDDSPGAVLDRAVRALRGTGSERAASPRPDATLALTDLYAVRSRLSGDDRLRADALLARPSDGGGDPFGDGYSTRSTKKCSPVICLHWVRSSADAPPSDRWAKKSLATMNKVWKFEVGKLGYRRPVADRGVGGNNKFDVYLKELGSRGVYGYCAPEYRAPGSKFVASGFCVLDDDFAKAQFGAPPAQSLKVTAAHEFFHAIQFAYDYHEDKWLLESTATWMEERFADAVDDNRQYLGAGQVRNPGIPLDVFNPEGLTHYGNWAFWEYLTQRYGNALVKSVWVQAGAFKGAGNLYSTKALKKVLARRGGFTTVFRAYAAANAIASKAYREGRAWPSARVKKAFVLGKASRRGVTSTRIDHMAANHVVFRPGSSLKGKRWKLRVVVDAPNRASGSAAYLIVKKRKGAWTKKPITLTRKGVGSASFTFSRNAVQSAIVTLVNANTSFRCFKRQPFFSCQGVPTGDNRKFVVKGQVLRR